MAESVILPIRVTQALRDRLDQMAERLGKDPEFTASRPGKVTRATVIREALARGLKELEQEENGF